MSNPTDDRIQDLLRRGNRPLGDDIRAPFVRWPKEDKGHIEITPIDIWQGNRGDVVRAIAEEATENIDGILGSGDEQQVLPIRKGDVVNVPMDLTLLKGKITEEHIGVRLCIAFLGKKPKKDGGEYCDFTVIPVTDGVASEDDLPF